MIYAFSPPMATLKCSPEKTALFYNGSNNAYLHIKAVRYKYILSLKLQTWYEVETCASDVPWQIILMGKVINVVEWPSYILQIGVTQD